MANPQPDKYVKISTEFLEALGKFQINGQARQIFDVIMRKTWGWNKKQDAISFTQFSESTGILAKNIPRLLAQLEERNLVIRKRGEEGDVTIYSIQKDYERWK